MRPGEQDGIEIPIARRPYGEPLFPRNGFPLPQGLTILVGCNGSGKTALLREIREHLKSKPDFSIAYYDNLRDGGSSAVSKAGFFGNMRQVLTLAQSSEGEAIYENLGTFIASLQTYPTDRPLAVLIDGADSGLSIDGIDELKEFLHFLADEIPSRPVYAVLSANTYELTAGERCLAVPKLVYRRFKGYDGYRRFILASRRRKDRRYHSYDKKETPS